MSRRILLLLCAAIVAAVSAMTLTETARAIGYFNLPGNCCQWWGYGCGPGYHAPLVLGPVSYRGYCAHHVERLPCAPCPSYCYADCGCGSDGCGCAIGKPSLLEPTVEPTSAPMPAPTPKPVLTPAAFRAPFRY